MNIQQMRYVVATAEHGSMTAAAAHLFVAQPALSRAVRALEAKLGEQLFTRASKGAHLTPTGEVFVRRARAVLRALDALADLRRDALEDALVISISPSLQLSLAMPILTTLRQHHGDLRIRFISCESSEGVHQMVAAHEADLGLSSRPVESDLPGTALGTVEVRLISPAALDLPDPLPFSALEGLPLVLPVPGSERREQFEGFFAAFGVRPDPVIESNERAVWLEAVAGGLASCLWHAVEPLSAFDSRIVSRGFETPLSQELVAVHRPDGASVAMGLFIDLVQKVIAMRAERPRWK